MNSIIQKLKNKSALKLYHSYIQGHCLDLSGNSNNGTPTSGCVFQGNEGLWISGTDKVTVANHASIQLTTGTWVFHTSEIRQQKNYNVFFTKQGPATSEIQFYIISTGLSVATTPESIIAVTTNHKKLFAFSYTSPGKPLFYQNGVYLGQGNISVTCGVKDIPINIGNDILNAYPINGCIKSVLIINRVLTASEHAALFYELENQKAERSI